MRGVQGDKAHSLQHPLMHPPCDLIRQVIVGFMAPPDQHVSAVQHLLSQTRLRLIQSRGANPVLRVRGDKLRQCPVNPLGINRRHSFVDFSWRNSFHIVIFFKASFSFPIGRKGNPPLSDLFQVFSVFLTAFSHRTPSPGSGRFSERPRRRNEPLRLSQSSLILISGCRKKPVSSCGCPAHHFLTDILRRPIPTFFRRAGPSAGPPRYPQTSGAFSARRALAGETGSLRQGSAVPPASKDFYSSRVSRATADETGRNGKPPR